MHERWKEDDQWKRDHYHQETAAEMRMTPEQRYSFDYNPMPKCVSVDSIIDSHGDGNLPNEPDFTEDLIELEDKAQKMALLLETLALQNPHPNHQVQEKNKSLPQVCFQQNSYSLLM